MSRVSRRVSVWMGRIGTRERDRDDRVTSDGARRVVFRAVAAACDKPVGSPETETDSWPALTSWVAPIDGQHTEEAKDHAAASSRSDRQVTRYLLGSYGWYRTTHR